MDELEILKIAHETDPSFTAQTYYADILKFAKAISAAERKACAGVAYEVANTPEFDEKTATAIKCRIMARANALADGPERR